MSLSKIIHRPLEGAREEGGRKRGMVSVIGDAGEEGGGRERGVVSVLNETMCQATNKVENGNNNNNKKKHIVHNCTCLQF